MNPVIHRIKHGSIEIDKFKHGPKPDFIPKTLRRYDSEHFIDSVLEVAEDGSTDGKFVLLSRSVSLPDSASKQSPTPLIAGTESLDQSTVDKIEAAESAEDDFDFVIFDNSPASRAEWVSKGRNKPRQAN